MLMDCCLAWQPQQKGSQVIVGHTRCCRPVQLSRMGVQVCCQLVQGKERGKVDTLIAGRQSGKTHWALLVH